MAKKEEKKKRVGWYIPEPLRHGLNSHAEHLSVEKPTTTDEMVARWLEERLKIEDRKRALQRLGIHEDDLPPSVRNRE
jgi:hypothetical protein